MIYKRISSLDDVIQVLEDLRNQTGGVSISSALFELGHFAGNHLDDVIERLKTEKAEMERLNALEGVRSK